MEKQKAIKSIQRKLQTCFAGEVYRNTIPQKFSDPATLKMVNADLAMHQAYNDIITKLEFQIEDSMEVQDQVSYSIINSVPGLGFILSLTILYESDDIYRFSDVGKFSSYCRLVTRMP